MRTIRQIAWTRDQLFIRFWRSASQALQTRKAWFIALAVFLVALVLLQLLMQVLLNLWNRDFFDALGRRDGHALWFQTQLFVPLAAVSIKSWIEYLPSRPLRTITSGC